MENTLFAIPSQLLDWIAVFGYLGITIFVAWRVINTQKKD